MMKLLIILNLSILLLLFTSVSKKKLSLFENLFVIMVIELFITSYGSVLYVNTNSWEISQGATSMVIFFLFETLVTPLLYLWLFNFYFTTKSVGKKLGLSVLTILLLLSLEIVLVKWEVISYAKWSAYYSLIGYLAILLITLPLIVLYKQYLQKEWIRSK